MSRILLSRNFHLDEFTRSAAAVRHGIDMRVAEGGMIHSNLLRLCRHVLQPLRDSLGPITILSGYRPPALNRLVGGSPHSQHVDGLAADIVVSNRTPLEVAQWLEKYGDYDQLILEFGEWVHVSVGGFDQPWRHEAMTAVKVPRTWGKPKTVYLAGIMPMGAAAQAVA